MKDQLGLKVRAKSGTLCPAQGENSLRLAPKLNLPKRLCAILAEFSDGPPGSEVPPWLAPEG